MTLEEENQELEKCNNDFNLMMDKRTITNKITCPKCRGMGAYLDRFDHPSLCLVCFGRKYIDPIENPSPFFDEKFKKIFVPFNSQGEDNA